MNQHRFLIHGSVHGITDEAATHFRRFERAGGNVEMLHGQSDAIVVYNGVCDQTTIESLIHILDLAGSCAENAHGVIMFGFEHQEPSHLHVGAAKKPHHLLDALASLHLKDWLARALHLDHRLPHDNKE